VKPWIVDTFEVCCHEAPEHDAAGAVVVPFLLGGIPCFRKRCPHSTKKYCQKMCLQCLVQHGLVELDWNSDCSGCFLRHDCLPNGQNQHALAYPLDLHVDLGKEVASYLALVSVACLHSSCCCCCCCLSCCLNRNYQMMAQTAEHCP